MKTSLVVISNYSKEIADHVLAFQDFRYRMKNIPLNEFPPISMSGPYTDYDFFAVGMLNGNRNNNNNNNNNNNHLIHGPPRFLPTRGSSRRGVLPPLRGGNSWTKESPVLPIPSYPALCLEDTTSWNNGRPRLNNRIKVPKFYQAVQNVPAYNL